MNTISRYFTIALSLCLIALIIYLVRKNKLKEKYAILWLLSGSVIFLFSIFPDILNVITPLLGIELPSNAVFFFGIIFIILINLHFSLVISNFSEQIKKLTQKLTLLEYAVSEGKKESCVKKNDS